MGKRVREGRGTRRAPARAAGTSKTGKGSGGPPRHAVRISGVRTGEPFFRLGDRTFANVFFNHGRSLSVTREDLERLVSNVGPFRLVIGRELSEEELEDLRWHEGNVRRGVFDSVMADPPERWHSPFPRSTHGKSTRKPS